MKNYLPVHRAATEQWRELPLVDRERVLRILMAVSVKDTGAAIAFNALRELAPAVYLLGGPLRVHRATHTPMHDRVVDTLKSGRLFTTRNAVVQACRGRRQDVFAAINDLIRHGTVVHDKNGLRVVC